MRQGIFSAGLMFALALALCVTTRAQKVSQDASTAKAVESDDHILLVLPFDNRSGQPSLEWIREASAEILTQRFRSAGLAPMTRDDRRYALDHLGLPQGFEPTRASSIKLADTVDADWIVVGSYRVEASSIVAEARLVDVPHLRMGEAVTAQGPMRDMIAVFSTLAWKLTRQMDPHFSVAQETFVAAGAGVRLDAFEQYIRGITESDQDERLRHLKRAVQLSPTYSRAWMALGREDYLSQQYEDAAGAFARVDRADPDALEAGFYRGLSLMFSGEYAGAEKVFAGVAKVLPLAEVLNNQGVALSRQGKDGTPLFRKAVAADPNAADYHFNLAVSLKRHGSSAEALTELAQCLRLHPGDSEAQAVEKAWKGWPAQPPPGQEEEEDVKADPLERIVRNFDARAFRQAVQMMDQVEAARLAALSPHERAEKLAEQAGDYLDRGLLLEAERLYQSAESADATLAQAHAGLAEVRERTGDVEAARKEARTALELGPSAQAYLVLARLDLDAGRIEEARKEAGEALKLTPQSSEAQKLERQIETKQGQKR